MNTQTSGSFYLAIVQAILIFGAETWVATPFIRRMLGSFHNRLERRIFEKKQAAGVLDLRVLPIGGSYTGGRVGRDRDLHIQAPEYGCAIYYNATYYGPLPEGGAVSRIVDSQEVVGSGGTDL